MKLYWSMPKDVRVQYQMELENYRKSFAEGHLQQAWRFLERAHILGQPWPREHSHVHFLMLRFGFHIKSAKEITGQIPRLLIGGVKSFVGKIPNGNTGGANVLPLLPMEIPDDLRAILKPYHGNHD